MYHTSTLFDRYWIPTFPIAPLQSTDTLTQTQQHVRRNTQQIKMNNCYYTANLTFFMNGQHFYSLFLQFHTLTHTHKHYIPIKCHRNLDLWCISALNPHTIQYCIIHNFNPFTISIYKIVFCTLKPSDSNEQSWIPHSKE